MMPFEEGTILSFATPMQGGLYAEVKSTTGKEAVVWWHPHSTEHTLGALEGALFLRGIKASGRYTVVKGGERETP